MGAPLGTEHVRAVVWCHSQGSEARILRGICRPDPQEYVAFHGFIFASETLGNER